MQSVLQSKSQDQPRLKRMEKLTLPSDVRIECHIDMGRHDSLEAIITMIYPHEIILELDPKHKLKTGEGHSRQRK